MGRVAIYTRVSTDKQTTSNQIAELERWAKNANHELVRIYEDAGVSGAKGRDKRPGFDRLLKDAVRREFDIIATWSADRLGRSLPNLIEVLQTIRQTGRELYIHTTALDTTTPGGRAMFQMLGVFAEFERELIVARVNAGVARAREKGTRSGKAIGRPRNGDYTEEQIRAALLAGRSVRAVVRQTGASIGTVAAVRRTISDSIRMDKRSGGIMSDDIYEFLEKWIVDNVEAIDRSLHAERAESLAELCYKEAAEAGFSEEEIEEAAAELCDGEGLASYIENKLAQAHAEESEDEDA